MEVARADVDLSRPRRRVFALLALDARPPALVCAGATDPRLRVLGLAPGAAPARVLEGHAGAVLALAPEPAGARLATGAADRTAAIWELATGRLLRRLGCEGMGYVHAVAWDAAGALVATGSDDMSVNADHRGPRPGLRFWDAASGALLRAQRAHVGGVHALAARPGARADHLASGGVDATVCVWRFSAGEHLQTLRGHRSVVYSLAASSAFIVSGSMDCTLRVWSWEHPACLRTIDTAGAVSACAWRGARLAVAHGATLVLWTAAGAPRDWTPEGPVCASACSFGAAVLPDGRLACATQSGAVALFALRTPRERRRRRRPAARL